MNKNTKKINISTKAFSLLELMFALVAISVFFAAYIPVITNQFSKEDVTLSSSGKLLTSQDCDINFKNNYGLLCTLCYSEESCVTCGGECPVGKIKNREKCDCL